MAKLLLKVVFCTAMIAASNPPNVGWSVMYACIVRGTPWFVVPVEVTRTADGTLVCESGQVRAEPVDPYQT